MNIPYVRGVVAKQAHVGLPDGTVEEEYARDGFSGRYAHLYRRNAPTGWTRIEGPLKPRAYDLRELSGRGGDYFEGRHGLLENEAMRLSFACLAEAMPYFARNADSDELFFVHEGKGTLETDFGPLAYRPGDYLHVPRGTVFRFAPDAATKLLVVETRGELSVPERGLLGHHALFDPAVVEVPTPGRASTLAPDARGEREVRVLRAGETTRIFYPFCPVDVVGYKGTLAPFRLSVHDIRPVMSERYHLPPSAHATFVAEGVIICTFLPRGLETGDERALRVPFFHANVDYDEVLFYHSGEFFSREGIAPGMLTFHPQGIHHGPQAGAEKRAMTATRTEEIAVMIDTKLPLTPTPDARHSERTEYWKSWQTPATTEGAK